MAGYPPVTIIIKSTLDDPDRINVGRSNTLNINLFREARLTKDVAMDTVPIGYLGDYQVNEGLMFTNGEVSTTIAEIYGPMIQIETNKGTMYLEVDSLPLM